MRPESEHPVLLIEDEPDAARLVEYVLSKSAPKLAVDWAPSLQTGLQSLREREYQAVLLDLNLPDSSGFETFARVRQQCRDRAVIVLTGVEDENLGLQAVRSGADDYLIKSEIRDRYLAQRIRYAVERKRLQGQRVGKTHRNGKIFAFAGAKGGVGTTTLVLNMAAAFAKLGKSVLAMELVAGYGSFAAHLRRSPAWNSSTLLQADPETLTRDEVESCLTDLECGFHVLFGPQKLDECCAADPRNVSALLCIATTLADYILVDLDATVASYTAEVVRHSRFTTLVLEQDWLGLHAACAKLPLLKAAGVREGGYGLAIVNKTPHVELLTPQELSRQIGCGLVLVIPPAGDQLASNRSASPFFSNSPNTSFSECIYEAAKRFCADPIRFVRF